MRRGTRSGSLATRLKSGFALVCASLAVACVAQGFAQETDAGRATIYIAKDGSDAWSGKLARPVLEDGPFATFERARKAVRDLKASGFSGEIVVEASEGLYELNAPLIFAREDGGTGEDSRVIWRAKEGDRVTISAGRRLSGVAKLTDKTVLDRLQPDVRDKIVAIDLNGQNVGDVGTPNNSAELFFKGEAATLARYPNEGFVKITAVSHDGTTEVDIRGTKGIKEGKFAFEDGRVAESAGEEDLWAHGYWFWDWSEQKQRVESLDAEGKSMVLAPPHHTYGYRPGQWFYIFNSLRELDAPGEFYIDRQKDVLYYYPTSGEWTEGDFMLTRLPIAVLFDGAEYMTLSGFEILGSRGDAITCKGALKNVTVRNCDVNCIGGTGISLHGTDLLVEGCELWNLGRAGISVGGGDRKTLTPSGNRIVDNYAHDYARIQRVYQPGVTVNGVGSYVAHNLVENAPHMGMGFSGNDHLFEYNEIANVCCESNDAGAVYTGRNWTMRGNLLRCNYLHDISGFRGNGCVGIYLDDMFSSADMIDNLFVNVTRAAFIGGGRDCKIAGNLFVNCRPALHIDARGAGWANDHIQGWLAEQKEKGTISGIAYDKPPYSERYPELASILDPEKKPEYPEGNEVTGNVCVGGTWDVNRNGQWQGDTIESKARPLLKMSDNFVADEDDGTFFVDAAKGDYRLKPDSAPALTGHSSLPVEKMGLSSDRMKAKAAARRAK